jgi:hypothetical protein
MITLYLDMDGVLCDFATTYHALRTYAKDGKRFRAAVMDYKIFEDLDPMPDAHVLLTKVSKLKDVNVEILTSLGTGAGNKWPDQASAAKKQKLHWLKKYDISYKPNFVYSKEEKAAYATSMSILIDDSLGCITPFERKGGYGILHTSAEKSVDTLNGLILQIRALFAFRG